MLVATHYWKPKYESGDVAILHEGDIGHTDFHTYVRDHNYPCSPPEIRAHALSWEGILRCQQSKPTSDIDISVVGDSHAEHLFLGIADALPSQNVAYFIVDGLPVPTDENFARILDYVAASSAMKTVVLDAYWGGRGVPENGLVETLRTLTKVRKSVFITDVESLISGLIHSAASTGRRSSCLQSARRAPAILKSGTQPTIPSSLTLFDRHRGYT